MKKSRFCLIAILVLCVLMCLACSAFSPKYEGGAITTKFYSVNNYHESNYTAHPNLEKIVPYYDITLTNYNSISTPKSLNSNIEANEKFTIENVSVGSYTLTVKAYKSPEFSPENLISEGEEKINVSPGEEYVSFNGIGLDVIEGGFGSFISNIKIPETTTIDKIKLSSEYNDLDGAEYTLSTTDNEYTPGATEDGYKSFDINVEDIPQGNYGVKIEYYSNDELTTSRVACIQSFANLESELNLIEETDLTTLMPIVKILNKWEGDTTRDGTLGNEYLDTDLLRVKSNITNKDYIIHCKFYGEEESVVSTLKNERLTTAIPSPDENGKLKIEVYITRWDETSETYETSETIVLDNIYFKTSMPRVNDLKNSEENPEEYEAVAKISNYDSSYQYKYQFGNSKNNSFSDLKHCAKDEYIKLNQIGPLVVRAKKGNFLESDALIEEYKIQLPKVLSAIYSESEDMLVIDYTNNNVLNGASLIYRNGINAQKELAYNEDGQYIIEGLVVNSNYPLTIKSHKKGWVDSAVSIVEPTSASIDFSIKDAEYYEGESLLDGAFTNSSNHVLAQECTFDFNLLKRGKDSIDINNSDVKLLFNNILYQPSDNKFNIPIDSINDKKIFIRITDPNNFTHLFYLKLQKDNRVDDNFNVIFTF